MNSSDNEATLGGGKAVAPGHLDHYTHAASLEDRGEVSELCRGGGSYEGIGDARFRVRQPDYQRCASHGQPGNSNPTAERHVVWAFKHWTGPADGVSELEANTRKGIPH